MSDAIKECRAAVLDCTKNGHNTAFVAADALARVLAGAEAAVAETAAEDVYQRTAALGSRGTEWNALQVLRDTRRDAILALLTTEPTDE